MLIELTKKEISILGNLLAEKCVEFKRTKRYRTEKETFETMENMGVKLMKALMDIKEEEK